MPAQIPQKNIEKDLQAKILQAVSTASPLQIIGAGSKSFYGQTIDAPVLEVAEHSGIIDYDPAELVITLRAGCKLAQVQALLAEQHQMLGFEPPLYNEHCTIGGMVATGLSGPRRAYAGGIRDFILGVKLLNGRGEIVNFGGRVIKNVAGFDVSRLMVGAMGTLGVILEVSLRVIPCFETEVTLGFDHNKEHDHIDWINQLGSKPWPLSASLWHGGRSLIRLSGSHQGVTSAVRQLCGDSEGDLWAQLKQQKHAFFSKDQALYRISVAPTCAAFLSKREQLIEWGGAQRWLRGDINLDELRQLVAAQKGSVCAFRRASKATQAFHPLNDAMLTLHRSLKSSFDPAGILNPGRMYAGL